MEKTKRCASFLRERNQMTTPNQRKRNFQLQLPSSTPSSWLTRETMLHAATQPSNASRIQTHAACLAAGTHTGMHVCMQDSTHVLTAHE
ncbi:MAG: hypothetical protein EOO65_05250 [Methanosarcinales archaeon]|nr:MAG: hypothetical protein EOO65_05250 [Methanosarcinales archaeon]